MAALAIVFGYLESLIPTGIPGVKLGLGNLVVLTAMYAVSARGAAAVSAVKIVLCGLLFGSFAGLLYSLAGGAASFLVMLLLKKSGRFGLVGVSVAGGVVHNAAQLAVACAVLGGIKLAYMLPLLLVSGVAAGLLVGFAAIPCVRLAEKIAGKGEK
ncbi:MAG: Gx transporter family protein [Oscillospiraceae bacterium]|nr:Gx transporter family protein [Oscillospiraceae bacterium]